MISKKQKDKKEWIKREKAKKRMRGVEGETMKRWSGELRRDRFKKMKYLQKGNGKWGGDDWRGLIKGGEE